MTAVMYCQRWLHCMNDAAFGMSGSSSGTVSHKLRQPMLVYLFHFSWIGPTYRHPVCLGYQDQSCANTFSFSILLLLTDKIFLLTQPSTIFMTLAQSHPFPLLMCPHPSPFPDFFFSTFLSFPAFALPFRHREACNAAIKPIGIPFVVFPQWAIAQSSKQVPISWASL